MKPFGTLTIIGAGLAGALLATLLAQRGWRVQVFEKRPDPRVKGYEAGRSINLALAERGLNALRSAGLAETVLAQSVMMRGRMVHSSDGHTELQPYGKNDSEVIHSVHRGRLNLTLLDAAEAAGAKIYFHQRIEDIDFANKILHLVDDRSRTASTHSFQRLIGADGAGSGVRYAMKKVIDLGERVDMLDHSYKELEIPPADNGDYQIEPNALHIWPRGRYMCIALPNTERTFTVTLFLPNLGEPSFASVISADQAKALFDREFADASAIIPKLGHDWVSHPTGLLATLYLQRWTLEDHTVLLGDAAHAMVPFHGQGMNCAFEDCVALLQAIERTDSWSHALDAFEFARKPNALAIQTMALENYLEMRDRVDDADYRLQRQLELALAQRHPDRFIPRYSMVSFMRVPYKLAFERGKIQRQILIDCTRDVDDYENIDHNAADRMVRDWLTVLDESN